MKMTKRPRNPNPSLRIKYKEEVTPVESIVYTDDEGDFLKLSLDKKALKIQCSIDNDTINFWVEEEYIKPLLDSLNKMVKLG